MFTKVVNKMLKNSTNCWFLWFLVKFSQNMFVRNSQECLLRSWRSIFQEIHRPFFSNNRTRIWNFFIVPFLDSVMLGIYEKFLRGPFISPPNPRFKMDDERFRQLLLKEINFNNLHKIPYQEQLTKNDCLGFKFEDLPAFSLNTFVFCPYLSSLC